MPIISACPAGRRCWGSARAAGLSWESASQGTKCWNLLALQVKPSCYTRLEQTLRSTQHLGFSFQEYQLFCSRARKRGGPVSMNLVLAVTRRLWTRWFGYALCGCAAAKQEFREGKGMEILTASRITDKVPVWSKCCRFCLDTIYTSVIWG